LITLNAVDFGTIHCPCGGGGGRRGCKRRERMQEEKKYDISFF
jgi:hypothetical protein